MYTHVAFLVMAAIVGTVVSTPQNLPGISAAFVNLLVHTTSGEIPLRSVWLSIHPVSIKIAIKIHSHLTYILCFLVSDCIRTYTCTMILSPMQSIPAGVPDLLP